MKHFVICDRMCDIDCSTGKKICSRVFCFVGGEGSMCIIILTCFQSKSKLCEKLFVVPLEKVNILKRSHFVCM